MFGDAKHVIDFGKSEFGMDTVRWVALMAIHGAVHFPANLGVKYTWVGPGYLSNVYYKMIANKPMYRNDRGELAQSCQQKAILNFDAQGG